MAFDADAACKHARSNAKVSPTGLCARHVREALMRGGLKLTDWPVHARAYGDYLPRYGFVDVSGPGYAPQPGDVVVLEPHPGGHPAGHIALYDGSAWVSDFVQRDHWGGPGFRTHAVPHRFFRHAGGEAA